MHQEGPWIINLLYLARLCISKHFKQRRRRLITMVIQRTSLRACLGGELHKSCTAAVNMFFLCLGLIQQVIKPVGRALTLLELFWSYEHTDIHDSFLLQKSSEITWNSVSSETHGTSFRCWKRQTTSVGGGSLCFGANPHPPLAPTCKPRPQLRVSSSRTSVHVEPWEMGAHLVLTGLSAEDWEHQTNITHS